MFLRRRGRVGNLVKKHQIGGWIALSAAVLQGEGLRKLLETCHRWCKKTLWKFVCGFLGDSVWRVFTFCRSCSQPFCMFDHVFQIELWKTGRARIYKLCAATHTQIVHNLYSLPVAKTCSMYETDTDSRAARFLEVWPLWSLTGRIVTMTMIICISLSLYIYIYILYYIILYYTII